MIHYSFEKEKARERVKGAEHNYVEGKEEVEEEKYTA